LTTWLLDTGPIVAYLDRNDPKHRQVVPVWDQFAGRFATTGAVITEAMQLLAGTAAGPDLLAELVLRSGMEVRDLCQPRPLRLAAQLMAKYVDTPMDFADATLVLLAEDLGVDEILTLDRRGFTVFRIRQRQPFRLLL
jgi:predicted nucleic acid-binding protein